MARLLPILEGQIIAFPGGGARCGSRAAWTVYALRDEQPGAEGAGRVLGVTRMLAKSSASAGAGAIS